MWQTRKSDVIKKGVTIREIKKTSRSENDNNTVGHTDGWISSKKKEKRYCKMKGRNSRMSAQMESGRTWWEGINYGLVFFFLLYAADYQPSCAHFNFIVIILDKLALKFLKKEINLHDLHFHFSAELNDDYTGLVRTEPPRLPSLHGPILNLTQTQKLIFFKNICQSGNSYSVTYSVRKAYIARFTSLLQ